MILTAGFHVKTHKHFDGSRFMRYVIRNYF